MGRWRTVAAVAAVSLAACGGPGEGETSEGRAAGGRVTIPTAGGSLDLEITEVATGLDTVWALAFDADGTLWYTERPGRVTRLGD
ncbi:MAG TPA: hypothetical protein VI854_09380, partial [Acidimicrobiia bacterium]|nr:hypothetical protein [Acidimicrobiia bacterium]